MRTWSGRYRLFSSLNLFVPITHGAARPARPQPASLMLAERMKGDISCAARPNLTQPPSPFTAGSAIPSPRGEVRIWTELSDKRRHKLCRLFQVTKVHHLIR